MNNLTLTFALGDTVSPIDSYPTLLFEVEGIILRKGTIHYELESVFPQEGLQLKVESYKLGIPNKDLYASYREQLERLYEEKEEALVKERTCECCGHYEYYNECY